MQLLCRKANSHKGDFGHIFVLAGSRNFSGAGLLCAEAAMRSGAGLVTLGVPEGLNNAVIRIKLKEVMTLPLAQTKELSLAFSAYKKIKDFIEKKADVLVIGPGLSQNKETQKLIRKVVTNCSKPTVIDADGLNALVGNLKDLYANNKIIITPHLGEMARLLGVTAGKIQENRKNIAKNFAKTYNITVVLKSNKTVVADSDNIYINNTGNPGMATAGSGDVLSGIIASFLAQGLFNFDAAKYAVYLHGLAGDLAANKKTQLSLIASDIIEELPQAIKKCS